MSERLTKRQRVNKGLRTMLGGLVLLIGIVAIPYPGPGWLIVFTGLAILARDYAVAQRVLDYAKSKYDAWQGWLRDQPAIIRMLFWVATATVVVLTIYLLNGYGILNDVLQLKIDWLNSPFV